MKVVENQESGWYFENMRKLHSIEMKQHIIFSANQLTRSKTNLCLSYKRNMENTQDSFSKYFVLSRGWEVRDCEDLGSYP